MDQFKKVPTKKQPEPDSQMQETPDAPEAVPPDNEEREKHQTGHQVANREKRRAPDEGQSRHRDKSKDRS